MSGIHSHYGYAGITTGIKIKTFCPYLHVTANTCNWKTTVELLDRTIKLFEGNE
jgi:hypothetical protein